MIDGRDTLRKLLALGGALQAQRARWTALERALERFEPTPAPILHVDTLAALCAPADPSHALRARLERLEDASRAREPAVAAANGTRSRPTAAQVASRIRAQGPLAAHDSRADASPVTSPAAAVPGAMPRAVALHPGASRISSPPTVSATATERVRARLAQLAAAFARGDARMSAARNVLEPEARRERSSIPPFEVSRAQATRVLAARYAHAAGAAWHSELATVEPQVIARSLLAPVSPAAAARSAAAAEPEPATRSLDAELTRVAAAVPAPAKPAPIAAPADAAANSSEGLRGLFERARATAAAPVQSALAPTPLAAPFGTPRVLASDAMVAGPALERAEEAWLGERLDRLLRRAARRHGIEIEEVSR